MDPSKRPTRRMKRVHVEEDDKVVVKIEPQPQRPPRGSVHEVVVLDEKDPRRERG